MGSLRSPCMTSYRSSIETIPLNCLLFEKITFLHFRDRQTDKQTDGQTDEHHRCVKPQSRYRELRLNKCSELKQHLLHAWLGTDQTIIDNAIYEQCRGHLRTCAGKRRTLRATIVTDNIEPYHKRRFSFCQMNILNSISY